MPARIPAETRIQQINALPNIEFIGWVGAYGGAHSKAICRCSIDGFEWSSTVHGIVNKGRGCPRCAEYGFNQAQSVALYALRSECGRYVKIGISNDYEKRHAILKRKTPFDWECIEVIHGDGDRIARLERYFLNKYEAANFSSVFDGYTEWLIYTPELMEEIRSMGACDA